MSTTWLEAGRLETSWQALHVFVPAERQNELIDAVFTLPVRRKLQEVPFFFLRYWQGGTHLRIRMQTHSEDPFWRELRADLERKAPALLDDASLESYRLGALAQDQLASLEGAQAISIREAGAVESAPYVPELSKYGGVRGVEVAEQLFWSTSQHVLGLLAQPGLTGASNLLGAAFQVMAQSLTGYGLDLREMALFCDGYTRQWSRYVPDFYTRTWDGTYEAVRDSLGVRLSSLMRNGENSPFAKTYSRVRSALIADESSVLSQIAMPDTESTREARMAYLLFQYVHTTNNRLGLMPGQEALVGFLLSRTIRDSLGWEVW